MDFRITILCDNSVGPIAGTLGEHGFSALIESTSGLALLFDTGQGFTLLHNAARMNKNLSAITSVLLSHGHYDHTGGLFSILQEYGSKKVYADPGVFVPRYRVKDTGESYPIGIPNTREELENAGAKFDLSSEFRSIAPGVYMTGAVPRITPFETGDSGLYCDCYGELLDSTADDQSLVLETGRGVVLVLGCCHAGIINTLEHVSVKLGRRDVYAVIGGTHLGFCDQQQLAKSIAGLKSWGIKKIAVSHCTGFVASSRLALEMPQAFQNAMVGYTLTA